MANVEVGWSSVRPARAGRHKAVGNYGIGTRGPGVYGMCPGVGSQCLETIRQAPLILNLQRIVVRRTSIAYQLRLRNVGTWTRYVGGKQQAPPRCTHIRGRNRLLGPEPLFQRYVPFECVRQL